MQQMVSRYRDRLINSSSQIKPLSASRQKSITNQSHDNLNNLPANNTPVLINHVHSSDSLKKSSHKTDMYSISRSNQFHQLQQQTQQKKRNNNPTSPFKDKQLISQHKTLSYLNNNHQGSSLPPQPQNNSNLSSTNIKQKDKYKTSFTNSAINNNLKSSRKVTNLALSHQKQEIKKEKEKQKEKSKSKRNNHKTPKKQNVIITPSMLNESYSESIYQIFVNDLKQKNIPNINNALVIMNKEEFKHKIKLFLEEYFSKRLQIYNAEFLNNQGVSEFIERSNRQMAYSYLYQNQQTSNINNQSQPYSLVQLPTTLPSKPQLVLSTGQKPSSFTSQLQKRFFQSQKQRQYLESKVGGLTKKLQSLSKQLQRYSKIQKLISNTIDLQNQSRKEVIRLRKQLEVSELKNSQQQKIWRKQVLEMREIIDELKQQLIQRYDDKSQQIQDGQEQ